MQEQRNEGWTVNKKRRHGVEEGRGQMETEEVCWKFNLGSFGTECGSTSRAAPKISLSESTIKANKDGKRIARPQIRLVPKAVHGSKIHQWQGVFPAIRGGNLQEDLQPDGSAIMYNGETTLTRRGGTRGLQDDKMDEGDTDDNNTTTKTDMLKVVLSGKQLPQIYKGIRKLQDGDITWENHCSFSTARSMSTRPGPAGPMSRPAGTAPEDAHPTSARTSKISHKVRQLWTGARHHQSAIPKETVPTTTAYKWWVIQTCKLLSTHPFKPWQRILLSGDVHPNSGPTTKYPCPVCACNVTGRGVSYLCNRCSGLQKRSRV